MNKLLFISGLSTIITASSTLAETAKKYEVPPSNSTGSLSVPSVSEEALKKCIVLYNEANWLADEIDATEVDRYNQASVDSYNAKITRHRNMMNTFNSDCAGKRSRSA